ncbi:MAG: cobalt-precorrin-5B (C(1))-methyltransferase [Microcoleus sp. SIO2G3]|nr:cobalt-precorrin-5B (C(1))-methyltransferase [Microcoleus sp. SIO2G3]
MADSPRAGYTLPVFACAAAIAAWRWLHEDLTALPTVTVDLLNPAETIEIAIEQVARLSPTSALAITRSDPGDNLDLTRNTPIWAIVSIGSADQTEAIALRGGEGIGRTAAGEAAIYGYARQLFEANLSRHLNAGEKIDVAIVLPEGRALADRTSNAAFGVVEGLSLLGTSGISQPLSAPGQLEAFRTALQQAQSDCLVFCVGENGLDLAAKLGVAGDRLIKTANWLGPMLVEAGMQNVPAILLFGYHGKLIKLAGGIFHTHHHVADARQEIFTAYCAQVGVPDLPKILASPTAEAALAYLRQLDREGSDWVEQVYKLLTTQIDRRAQAYIQTHSDRTVRVGSVLFDRNRSIIAASPIGAELLRQISSQPETLTFHKSPGNAKNNRENER